MTFQEMFQEGTRKLLEAGIEDARTDAWYLLEHSTGMDRAAFFLHGIDVVTPKIRQEYGHLVEKRCKHIPLQYLTGTWEFMGLEFIVTPQVLIPRQDTELLVEELLSVSPGKSLLYLCTGSGCIAISLAKLGKARKVHGIDVSKEALTIAQKNQELLHVDVEFWQSDLYENIQERYDIIVSNPPYIRRELLAELEPEVVDHEPRIALDGGVDGLDFYRRILQGARDYLSPEGMLAVEIGYDQAEEVIGLFQEQNFGNIICKQDLCGHDRIVMGSVKVEEERKCLTI